jgi:iron-sulfur cluster repair protein YtfE (RIC family)
MEYILDLLKSEHRLIVNLLNKIRIEGISSDEAIEELMAAKKLLLQHLKKEDEIIYPVLFGNKSKDSNFNNRLIKLDEEMEKITERVMTYFSDYSDGKNAGNFSSDTKAVYEMLKTRILNEETILFPEYERMCSAELNKL